MGETNKEYTVFIGDTEIKSIDCDEFKFEDDTTILPIKMSTVYGDVEFTAVFTKQQFADYLTMCQKIDRKDDK